MNTRILASLLTVVLTAQVASVSASEYAYVHSTIGLPWGQTVDIDAMNTLFGATNVDTLNYETLDLNDLFSPQRRFVYMSGGDSNSAVLGSFITSNQTAIENWVAGGGALVVMAAENSGGLTTFGFGSTWSADLSSSGNGVVVDETHPIFNGTGVSNGDILAGTGFHHDLISGPGFSVIAASEDSGNSILIDRDFGAGYVMLGTLTTRNFWSAPTAIQDNIFLYAASQGVPEPTSLALVGLAVVGFTTRRKKRLF